MSGYDYTAHQGFGIRGFGYVPERVYRKEAPGLGIVGYGLQNTYPQEVELAIARSSVASASRKIFAEFLYGNGFRDERTAKAIVNNKGQTNNDILLGVCYDFATYFGLGIRLNANLLEEYTSMEKEPFSYVRLMMPEEDRFVKAKVSDDWADESIYLNKSYMEAEEVCLFDPGRILEQIEEAGGIGEYRGQLLYFTTNGGFYPVSPFDPAMAQILAQGDLSEFNSNTVKNGFSVSAVFINESESADDETFRNNVEQVTNFAGIRGAGGVGYMEGKISMLKPELTNLTDQYNALRIGIREDVVEAMGIPPILLGRSYNGGFPNQEELLNAFAFYNGNTEQYRRMISRQFEKIAERFAYDIGQDFSIAPKQFIEEDEESGLQTETAADKLKGSVGGVTSIIALQAAVKEGTASVEGAIAVLMALYNFDEETARKIVS